jgi:ribosomal protein S16
MPVRLRLARVGVRNTPAYHVVAIRSSKRTTAKPIEQLGSYDPVPKLRRLPTESVLDGIQEGSMQKALVINRKRVLYWLGVGAQPSDSVKSLLQLVRLSFCSLCILTAWIVGH